MEQKAKKIGKLNVIDLIAIVLIVAVLALAAWKFLGGNGDSINAEQAQTKVTYQVKVEGVAPELYDNCLKHLPSPLMASGALVGGQIESVEKMDYQVMDANGNWVTDPEHVTLLFTVTTTTPTADVMTTKVGDQEVRQRRHLRGHRLPGAEGVYCPVPPGSLHRPQGYILPL